MVGCTVAVRLCDLPLTQRQKERLVDLVGMERICEAGPNPKPKTPWGCFFLVSVFFDGLLNVCLYKVLRIPLWKIMEDARLINFPHVMRPENWRHDAESGLLS